MQPWFRRFSALAISLIIGFSTTGCGSNDQSSQEPKRSYDLHLKVDDSTEKYDFVATDHVDVQVGDEVTFVLNNNGQFVHDLQVLDENRSVLGTAAAAPVGGTSEVTVQFPTAGTYILTCNYEDHLTAHQMFAAIKVTEPS